MSDTTQRPVIIQYREDVDPKDGRGAHLRGETYEAPNPEYAWTFHPDATIVRYSDGADYSDRKAKAEVRERDAPAEPKPKTASRKTRTTRTTEAPVQVQLDLSDGSVDSGASEGATGASDGAVSRSEDHEE